MIPSSSLLSGMIDAAVRSLLVAAAVGLGLSALRARNVVAQKAAWMLVLCAAVLMPVLAPWASQTTWVPAQAIVKVPQFVWPVRHAATATVPAQPANALPERQRSFKAGPPGSAPIANSESALPAGVTGTHFPAPSISYASSGSAYVPASAPPKTSEISISAAGVAVLLYGLVCAVLLGRVAWGAWAAARLWFSAETITLYPHQAVQGLKLRASRGIASPVTVGSGIVLPEDYTEWDSEKLRIVLAHEASHVRQRDFYVQLGASLYASLFWFSPLGWWLKRKLSDLSETISDRAAVEHAASHASYAQVLLEFAALPHPIPTGVAMARKGRLVPRIERLLNESSFRQAFSGGRARIAAAVLLVPASLFAATALVRVQAGAQSSGVQPPPPPAKALAAPPKMDAPPSPAIAGQPAPPAPADQAPAAPSAPAIAAVPPSGPAAPAIPPPPPDAVGVGSGAGFGAGESWSVSSSQSETTPKGSHRSGSSFSLKGKDYAYSYQNNGDSYALISGNDNVTFSGDWYDGRKAELDKAKRMAHGDFLWFTRNGKSYVMDDPQTIAQIKAMYAPMEALGKQQEELGRQQEELGRKQEALGNQQEQAGVPAPEMTKEIAAVEKAAAELKAAKGQSLSQDKLADIQEKLADLQSRLADMQGEVGEKQGALGEQQGKLGEQQGKLGEQQGRLGEQQGRLAVEADKKIKSIIDESLKNGKARPVE